MEQKNSLIQNITLSLLQIAAFKAQRDLVGGKGEISWGRVNHTNTNLYITEYNMQQCAEKCTICFHELETENLIHKQQSSSVMSMGSTQGQILQSIHNLTELYVLLVFPKLEL